MKEKIKGRKEIEDRRELRLKEIYYERKLNYIDMELFKLMGDLHDSELLKGKGQHLAYRLKGASVIVNHVRELIKKGIN